MQYTTLENSFESTYKPSKSPVPHLTTTDLDAIILDAIDDSLSTLGEKSKTSIYTYLQQTFGVEKQEIPQKISQFQAAITKIFGPQVDSIEKLITQTFRGKLNHFSGPNFQQEPAISSFSDITRLREQTEDETVEFSCFEEI